MSLLISLFLLGEIECIPLPTVLFFPAASMLASCSSLAFCNYGVDRPGQVIERTYMRPSLARTGLMTYARTGSASHAIKLGPWSSPRPPSHVREVVEFYQKALRNFLTADSAFTGQPPPILPLPELDEHKILHEWNHVNSKPAILLDHSRGDRVVHVQKCELLSLGRS